MAAGASSSASNAARCETPPLAPTSGMGSRFRNGPRTRALDRDSACEVKMSLGLVYGLGALVLLVALIYGALQYHYRNRAATRIGDQVARDRYRNDEG